MLIIIMILQIYKLQQLTQQARNMQAGFGEITVRNLQCNIKFREIIIIVQTQ